MSNIEFAKFFVMTLAAASAIVVPFQCYRYTHWYKKAESTKSPAHHAYHGFEENVGPARA